MGLYLVRKQNGLILGPMVLEDLLKELETLQVGLEDEITGNLGPWVSLESPDIAAIYPEVSVQLENRLSWHSGEENLFTKKWDTKKSPFFTNTEYFILGIILGVTVLAFLIKDDINLKLHKEGAVHKTVSVAKTIDELEHHYNLGNVKAVRVSIDNAVSRGAFQNDSDKIKQLIPYARYVAFSKHGPEKFGIFSSEILRGEHSDEIPESCSVATWVNIFSDLISQKSDQNFENIVEYNAELKVLLWNPFWISIRPSKGWKYPINLHHGCLVRALSAIKMIKKSKLTLNIKKRLEHQVKSLEKPTVNFKDNLYSLQKYNTLDALTCLESGGGRRCLRLMKLDNANGDFFNRQHVMYKVYSSLIGNKKISDYHTLPNKDDLLKIDIFAESFYLESLNRLNNPNQALMLLKEKFPDLDLP